MWVGRGILLHTGMQASREPVSFQLRTSPLSRASESSIASLADRMMREAKETKKVTEVRGGQAWN